MFVLQGWPDCLEVGRRKDETKACPTCGAAPLTWYFAYREADGTWTKQNATTKAEAIEAGKAYARESNVREGRGPDERRPYSEHYNKPGTTKGEG